MRTRRRPIVETNGIRTGFPAWRDRFGRTDPLFHSMIRALCAALVVCALSWPASAADAPLTTILLVAQPEIRDPNFKGSVVLVMNNIAPGPVGVIINKPTDIAISHLFPDLENLAPLDDKVYFGGPVDIGMVSFLIRADAAPEHATEVVPGVYLSTNRELLRKLLGRA